MSLLSEDHEPFRLLPLAAPDDTDLFSFSGSVGPNGENRRKDVIRAQTLLAHSGDFNGFDVPTGWPSSDLYRGIRKFQKRNGMDADGTLLPVPPGGVDKYGVGETVEALRSTLGEQLAGRKARTSAEVDAHYEKEARSSTATGEEQNGIVLSDVPDAAPPQPKPGQQVAQAPAQRDNVQTGTTNMQPAAPKPLPKPMPLPDFKKDYFARPANKGVWSESQSALQRQLPDQPVMRESFSRIYAEEGGRIRDPNDTAVGGLTAGTLRELQDRGLLPDLPKDTTPQSLTPDQQIQAYRAHLDQTMRHVGGARALEALDPDFAHAIADAAFMHGSSGGMRAVQQAIRESGMEPNIKVDGGMGPNTLDALKRANDDPALREALQNKIADIRSNLKEWEPGELERINRARPGAWKH